MTLGFDAFFQETFERLTKEDKENKIPVRIVFEGKNIYQALTLDRELLQVELSGRFYHRLSSSLGRPTTGDWVLIHKVPASQRGRIEGLLPRKSLLKRKAAGSRTEEWQLLAANLDYLWILSSLNQDLSWNRIERYTSLAWSAGVRPVILLTKADLAISPPSFLEETAQRFRDCSIHVLSSQSGLGLEDLSLYLKPDVTVGLMGSSGVGKSTLVNRLCGEELLSTQKVREEDAKGRHTTTGRYLLELPGGAMIMDTPGMRELQLTQDTSLDASFSSLEELSLRCKFSDCTHEKEPACAVQAALASGEISAEYLSSYQKLKRELAYQARKGNPALMKEEKERWKKRSKSLKRDRY